MNYHSKADDLPLAKFKLQDEAKCYRMDFGPNLTFAPLYQSTNTGHEGIDQYLLPRLALLLNTPYHLDTSKAYPNTHKRHRCR